MILQQLRFLEPPRVHEELFLLFLAHCSMPKAFTIPKNSCTVPPCDICAVNRGITKPLAAQHVLLLQPLQPPSLTQSDLILHPFYRGTASHGIPPDGFCAATNRSHGHRALSPAAHPDATGVCSALPTPVCQRVHYEQTSQSK